MKFRCQKNDIVQAIQIVMKAVSTKPQTPILSGIYMKAADNQLVLQAMDYEIGIICNIEAEVEIPGEIVIVGRYAQEVVRRLPGSTVDFEYNSQEKMVYIKSNRSKFSFLSMNAADYPTINRVQGNHNFQIADVTLKDLIANTSFACSHEESRPVFTGCLLELKNDAIVMAATDTHRLAVKSDTIEDFQGEQKLIIPAKLLNELLKILQSDMPRSVNICCSQTQISFEVDNVYISSRLIEGQFPDYHRVIPLEFKTNITMKTDEIKGIIDRIALISRTNDYNVVTMEFASSMVKISSANPEIGDGEEYAGAVIDGEDIRISFNADYINDALKLIKSEEFTIALNGPLSSVCIRTEKDPNFTYIVTPVRS
ncbi:MAG: DNA polymerase III subunit beta [Anaerovibrio sp.]|nr:DNA polymerase III subunit beta [Anaerovibrio sp.]